MSMVTTIHGSVNDFLQGEEPLAGPLIKKMAEILI